MCIFYEYMAASALKYRSASFWKTWVYNWTNFWMRESLWTLFSRTVLFFKGWKYPSQQVLVQSTIVTGHMEVYVNPKDMILFYYIPPFIISIIFI